MMTQTCTPTVVQEGGRGGGGGGVAVLQYLGNILPLIDSLSCDLQDGVNIICYGTTGGSSRLGFH